MSDLRLRQAQRAAACGGVEERAAWLRERVRAGERGVVPCGDGCEGGHVTLRQIARHEFKVSFTPIGDQSPLAPGVTRLDQDAEYLCPACEGTGFAPFGVAVELAAYAGDEAAQKALGHGPAQQMLARTTPLDVLLRNLARYPGAAARAAVAAARVALEVWEKGDSGQGRCTEQPFGRECACGWHLPRRAIEAAEAWLADPSDAHEDAALRLVNAAPDPWASMLLLFGKWEPDSSARDARRAVSGFAEIAGEAAVRSSICEALIEWALA